MDRPPKNLQELLKFAVRHQDTTTDSNGETKPVEIDEEKRQFLENVLQSMTVDVCGELVKAIQILEDKTSTKDDQIEALNAIRDYIDNIDFANSFVKLDGTKILISCIKCEDSDIRTTATNVLAELSQNNTFCQDHFLFKTDVVRLLISHLSHKDEQIVASSLYALSSLMQNFEPATMEFTRCGGVPQVLSCLANKHSRVFVKSCFLISSISSQFPAIRDEFAGRDAFGQLFENLECVNDFDVRAEALLIALATLTESDNFKPDPKEKDNMSKMLKEILENIKGLPQCEEMEMYSNKILSKLQ